MTLNHIEKIDAMITINTGRITRQSMPAQSVVFSKHSEVIEAWMLEGPRGGCYLLYFYKNGNFRCFNFNSVSMNDLAQGRVEHVVIERVEREEENTETVESVDTPEGTKATKEEDDTVVEGDLEVSAPKRSYEERKVIAQTIIEQMGGWGRISIMTGAKTAGVLDSGVRVVFPNKLRAKPNCVVVNYDEGADLYNVEFWRVSSRQPWNDKKLKTFDGVYCDMLVNLFEENTGLRLVL